MSRLRIFDAAMGGVLVVGMVASLLAEGFPRGGMAFAGAIAYFRLAARP